MTSKKTNAGQAEAKKIKKTFISKLGMSKEKRCKKKTQ